MVTRTVTVYCPQGHEVEVTAYPDGDLNVAGRWSGDRDPDGDGWAVPCPHPACEWEPAFYLTADLTTL